MAQRTHGHTCIRWCTIVADLPCCPQEGGAQQTMAKPLSGAARCRGLVLALYKLRQSVGGGELRPLGPPKGRLALQRIGVGTRQVQPLRASRAPSQHRCQTRCCCTESNPANEPLTHPAGRAGEFAEPELHPPPCRSCRKAMPPHFERRNGARAEDGKARPASRRGSPQKLAKKAN